MTSLAIRLGRQLDFARHLPPRQILRRARLALRRRVEALTRPSLDCGALIPAPDPPLPIFPPRGGMATRTGEGWRFRFLGRDFAMGGAIDWRAPGHGPRDQLWRMNLHYMEYLEEVADAEFAALVDSWIGSNPAYARGSATDSWNAYSLSLRAMVWMQRLALRRDGLDPLLIASANASLAGQIRYLERHLETDVNGNHLVKNIKALIWASRYFEGRAAARWRRKGLALLARELPRQFLDDGVHYELSPTYHCQVLADLIEIRHALGGDPCPQGLDDRILAAAQAAADLAHPDDGAAQFADGGIGAAYSPGACLDACRAVLGRAPAQRPNFALEASGLHGVREGNNYFVVDYGPLATDAIPGHSHGDIFSFEWSVGGERIVVDQGVYEYAPGERRQASRSASSHNTLVVAGGDQADFFGAFRSRRRARVELIRHELRADGFLLEGRHDGFRRLAGAPVHRRRFEASAGRIRITDWIEGGVLPATVSLLLAAGARIERIGPSEIRVTRGRASVSVQASLPIEVEPAIWWPDMGVELATHRLVVRLGPQVRRSELALTALG